jgi:hypothetical protein
MKPDYNPSPFCRRVTNVILAVYDNADWREKEALNKLTKPLMMKIKESKNQMSREMALEVIGKIGIVLAKNNQKS